MIDSTNYDKIVPAKWNQDVLMALHVLDMKSDALLMRQVWHTDVKSSDASHHAPNCLKCTLFLGLLIIPKCRKHD